jgi:hypothetical protein
MYLPHSQHKQVVEPYVCSMVLGAESVESRFLALEALSAECQLDFFTTL